MLELQQKAFGERCYQDLHLSGHLDKQNQHAMGKERKRRVIGSQEESGGSRCQKQSVESPISGKSSEAEASAGGLLKLQQKALGKMCNQGIQ